MVRKPNIRVYQEVGGSLVLRLREAILEAYYSVIGVFVLGILYKVSGSYKLELLPCFSGCKGRLNHTVLKLCNRILVKIVVVGLVLGDITGVFDLKEEIVKHHGCTLCILRAEPMNSSLHLSAVGRHTVTCFEIGSTTDFGNVSVFILEVDGIVVEKTNSADAAQYTKITGVLLTAPQVGIKAEAAQSIPDETTPDGETVPVTVTGAEQLDVAISLMQYLEESGILGEIATIDVADLGDLEMWYGTRFHVLLGNATDLKNKVFAVKGAIDKSGNTEQRILDATFTTGPNQVISRPLK